ncbi:MAG: Gfo/Idh/MocA family oxidoreductase [Syntrophothermus sp.]
MLNKTEGQNILSRRDFIKAAAAAGTGVIFSQNPVFARLSNPARKTRYAQVGTGHRAKMYQDAIYKTYTSSCQMVGFCDTNLGRLKLAQSKAQKVTGVDIPIFEAKGFDRMIKETKPDIVIVTTVDGFHHEYIVRALELGKDVITEKPLTVDEEKCQQIIDAQRKTGRKVTVAFNYRYSPVRTQVKELLMDGVIGDVLSVDFHWMLNTLHGADYFRRWHSQKKFSGGLMVHKATHHFDLINWWLSAVPVTVFGKGKREFYTPEMIKRFGLEGFHERCHTCPEKEKCAFELNIEKDNYLKELYLDNESYDGYFRDRCIFRPDTDIEDTMNVIAKYDNNATMSYSLNAFNSWEGYYVIFNGTKGRLEHKMEEKVFLSKDNLNTQALKGDGTYIRIYPIRGAAYNVEARSGEGGHAGGDNVLLEDLFSPEKKSDRCLRASDYRAGAYACLTGIAANKSFKTNSEINISGLVKNLDKPDLAVMPSKSEKISMPEKNV